MPSSAFQTAPHRSRDTRSEISRIGYARRMARGDLPEVVRSAITAECDEFFEDDLGKTPTSRPALKLALGHLRRGDVFVIAGLSHLGLATKQLLELLEKFHQDGVSLHSLEEGIEGGSAFSAAVMRSGAVLAAVQREVRRERIKEGVREASVAGRMRGARPSLSARTMTTVRNLMRDTDLTMAQIAESVGTSRNTLYRTLKREAEAEAGPRPTTAPPPACERRKGLELMRDKLHLIDPSRLAMA